MNFSIDQQSFKDLNIFTSSADADAIVNLFKLTKTIGGREMLYEMMNNPSSDITFLRNRVDSLQYFYDQKIIIDISSHQLDLIEHYLKHDKRHLKSNIIDASFDFIRDKFFPGTDYYIIVTGITNILKLRIFLQEYIEMIIGGNAPAGLKAHAGRMQEILALPVIKKAVSLSPNKLKFYHISRIDKVFRKQFKEALKELLRLVYELDVYECLAYVIDQKGLCLPHYSESEALRVSLLALYHPGIKNAVANDVDIRERNNMTFLTGSNMAGKSSFLKAVGLSVYLAHIGFPVFAKEMTTTIFNGMITTINLPDNLTQGLSHYYSEVKRVKDVAIKLNEDKKIFVIFDELFRGTNVKDAFDASLLIISELTNIKSSVFLISTHIVELAEELKGYHNVSFKYMDTFFENDRPVFTYKLMSGISKERLGMYIVNNEGIVDIIKEAVKNQ